MAVSIIMSEGMKNAESYPASLCREAEELGAAKAMVIPASDVVLDERTLLKCLVPLCPSYGINLMCPPNVLPISKFREILKRYHSAILIKVDIPLSDQSERMQEQPETPRLKYRDVTENAKRKLHEIVNQIESACIEAGYPFAAGLIGGSCQLCDECVGVRSGLPCRHPYQARPAMEAMGIDVIATVKKAGLSLSFSQNEGRHWIGLVLVA